MSRNTVNNVASSASKRGLGLRSFMSGGLLGMHLNKSESLHSKPFIGFNCGWCISTR